MKIERLIGIIAILQRHKVVTAPYLAEKFEVSRRTINRDIEDICKAGIPIVTTQGCHGGISLMEGFSLDTTVFTEQELSAILTGLKSLDSVSKLPSTGKLASKLAGDSALPLKDDMLIDLSSFYKDDLADKIEQIKLAIKEARCILFHYCYDKGESDKQIEPYLIIFKWSNWYVFGFCRDRKDFRLYRLRRMWDLKVMEERYQARDVPAEKKCFGSHMTDDYVITAVYDASVKYRLVEKYGHQSFTERADGSLLTKWGFTSPENAVEWFLSFGDKVQVLDPPEMVELMKASISSIQKIYET